MGSALCGGGYLVLHRANRAKGWQAALVFYAPWYAPRVLALRQPEDSDRAWRAKVRQAAKGRTIYRSVREIMPMLLETK